jgi:hypothetical protein
VEKKRKTVNTRRVLSAAELVVGGVITKLQSNSIVADWIYKDTNTLVSNPEDSQHYMSCSCNPKP